MKIEYFQKDGTLDVSALHGGVYRVDMQINDEVINLYVGEAGCIVKRCGQHLLKLSNDLGYFGLVNENLEIENLTIRFSVHKPIQKAKQLNHDADYIEEQNLVKSNLKPLLQVPSQKSDRMLSEKQKIQI